MILLLGCVLSACDRSLEIGRSGNLTPVDAMGSGGSTPPVDAADDEPIEVAEVADAAEDTAAPDTMVDAGVDLTPGTILWSANAEPGDTSEWEQGGATTGGTFRSGTTTSVTTEQAHGGARAYKIVFNTADGNDHLAEFYRRVVPQPAYYSAWFFIDQAHTPGTYWTLLYFFYRKDPTSAGSRQGLWDVNVDRTGMYFYDEIAQHTVNPQPRKAYPSGQWFHVEAYFAYEGQKNGHIKVWLDGDQILDAANLGAPPNDNLYWGVGSDTDQLTPDDCTIYIDDAAISTERLGP